MPNQSWGRGGTRLSLSNSVRRPIPSRGTGIASLPPVSEHHSKSLWQRLIAERRLDLCIDAVLAEEARDAGGVDEHVLVMLGIPMPRAIAVGHEGRHVPDEAIG